MRRIQAIILTGIFFLISRLLAASACDIANVDFRNRVIVARRHTPEKTPFYGTFNGPAPSGPLRLRNGLFLEWDIPESMLPPEERREYQNKPDWKTEIDKDVMARPEGSSGIRLLQLLQSHVTGSGSFIYVFGFDCHNGSVRKVFEASGSGLKLVHAAADSLELSVGIWAEADPHAAPSRVEHLQY